MNGHSFIFYYINGKLYFKVVEYIKILRQYTKLTTHH